MSLTSHEPLAQNSPATRSALPSTSTTASSAAVLEGGVHDYARRMAFLTELDSQTWLGRYSAAERLGDPGAVGSPAGYASWLRRIGAAWAQVPMPTTAQAASVWPFSAISPLALDAVGQIDADLRELALANGGPRPTPLGAAGRSALSAQAAAAAEEDIDAAYVAGAAYVAIATAQEVAVLAADVEHLSVTVCRTPLPQHYIRHAAQVCGVRSMVRRELGEWAQTAGPDAAERVVLAARMLTEHLSTALEGGVRPGW
jgi:hypothetical protein